MKIAVIGAGSWGTALASVLADGPDEVLLWAHEPFVADGINENHKNPLYLQEDMLPASLKATSQLPKALKGASVVVSVVPSHLTRRVMTQAVPHVAADAMIVNASKGFEFDTGKRLSEVLAEALPQVSAGNFVTLSGPSFAKEVVRRLPTTVVIAGQNPKVTEKIQKLFRRDYFLTYTGKDVIGVEVGGAVKNVIAIAAGICDGMGLGCNTRAALITRGLYEMAKLGKALGANPITFAGLTGIGDLVLTCTGELSRNRTVGLRLGRGEKLSDITKEMKNVAEGIKTAKVVYDLIQKYKMSNPLCVEIYRMLYENKPPRQALKDLLALDLKEELGGLLK
ncbi:MAG: NAD(P)H-dependent glycerol-3-phosphate dehydrogenase [Deltaproteobacteria bacterium]|nr:NAD(P)H-dependent glycerol-3-phosphate dehydrogenase [Deltaproteobacteria bacterium]